jgi:hypothetical protein
MRKKKDAEKSGSTILRGSKELPTDEEQRDDNEVSRGRKMED